jgi:hypothetical protein
VTGTITSALTLTSNPSATTQVGQSYMQTNVGSGGTTPYTYSVSAGTLPAGTTLNTSTGTVSGTPTTAGAFSYTTKVTDSGSPTAQTATQTVTGTITSVLTLTSIPSATTQVGQSYMQTNVGSGGTTPYTYSVSAGTLPSGTTLNTSTGTVSGTPTTAGAFSYTIKVTDSGSPTAQTATQTVSGTMVAGPPTLSARTWVSASAGNDSNPCSRTAPCLTFAGALAKTTAGGEIDALDSGDYGPVTITKAITLDGGNVAYIGAAGSNGITISAGPNDVVIIRNLRIDGLN